MRVKLCVCMSVRLRSCVCARIFFCVSVCSHVGDMNLVSKMSQQIRAADSNSRMVQLYMSKQMDAKGMLTNE